jgi:hypothetical protein
MESSSPDDRRACPRLRVDRPSLVLDRMTAVWPIRPSCFRIGLDSGSSVSGMTVPPVVRQEQLIAEIALHLADEVEGAWSTLVFNHRNLSMFFTGRIDVHRPDGSFAHVRPPDSVLSLTDELRRVMYEPGKGAWFSARWTIASGEVDEEKNPPQIVFNYDDEPVWRWPAHPGLYALDLETFPRDDDRVPAWLRQKVNGARRTL